VPTNGCRPARRAGAARRRRHRGSGQRWPQRVERLLATRAVRHRRLRRQAARRRRSARAEAGHERSGLGVVEVSATHQAILDEGAYRPRDGASVLAERRLALPDRRMPFANGDARRAWPRTELTAPSSGIRRSRRFRGEAPSGVLARGAVTSGSRAPRCRSTPGPSARLPAGTGAGGEASLNRVLNERHSQPRDD
jgi:hypothetical protein